MLSPRDLGQQIRRAREVRGLTQVELGQLLDLEQSSISDLENGITKIGALDLLKIARVLDMPPSFFLPELITEGLTSDEGALLSYFRAFEGEDKQLVLEDVRLHFRHMAGSSK